MDAPNLDAYLQQRFARELYRPAQVIVLSESELRSLRAGAGVETIVSSSKKVAPEQNGKITRQEAAKGDDIKKQQYLDQLLRDNPSPYVKGLIYDPKGEHLDVHRKELIAKGLLDPSEIEIKDIDLENILESQASKIDPQYREAFKSCMIQFSKEQGITDLAAAGTLFGARTIGRNEKSYVFVRATFFSYGDEELAQILLAHEYIHAQHNYEGIKVGHYKIDYKTVEKQKIQHETLVGLTDSIAWIDTIQRLKKSPKYGPKSDMYLQAVGTLFIYDLILQEVKPNSDFERKVIEYQRNQNKQNLSKDVVSEFERLIRQMLEKVLKCLDEYGSKQPLLVPPLLIQAP